MRRIPPRVMMALATSFAQQPARRSARPNLTAEVAGA